MKAVAIMSIFSLLFFILMIGIGIFIQIKLSKNQNRYLGLILPGISLILSLRIGLGMVLVGEMGSINYLNVFFMFLIANIPTAILGGIYLGERNKMELKKSIEKTKIEDL